MFSTGSKLFLGLTGAALAGFVVYGFLQQWGALGVIGLASAAVVLAFLAGVVMFVRDGDVAPTADAATLAAAPGAQAPARTSLWPVIGAAGGGLLVIGLVTDRRWFAAGIAAILVAIVEWMVQAWSERATADAEYNAKVRGHVLHPLELPVLASVGLGVIIFSFSRMMLTSSHDVGPYLFIAIAAVITMFGFILAGRRRPSKAVVAAICVVGSVGMVGGGVWAAAKGERPELAKEGHIFRDEPGKPSVRSECGPEETEADHKASGAVAAKSSYQAQLVLKGNALYAFEFGQQVDRVVIPRSNYVNILFKNDNGDDKDVVRRLAAAYLVSAVDSAGKPTTALARETVCTNAIEDGKVQMLTFRIPKPSAAAAEGQPFKFFVPGIDGAEIEIEVP